MFAAAQVYFRNTRGTEILEWLESQLRVRLPIAVERTAWRGFGVEIPQILVHTSPIALTLQLEDDPDLAEELEELVEDSEGNLSPSDIHRLEQTNARIEVLAYEPSPTPGQEPSQVVIAATSLDTSNPEVLMVLREVQEMLCGFIIDCTDGSLTSPRDD